MPSLKEIKGRIASVNSTRKITSAMKMVASSKLHHAQVAIQNMLPYETMLEHILKSFLAAEAEPQTIFDQERPVKRVALVVFSSNSSLCGGFNANVIAVTASISLENFEKDSSSRYCAWSIFSVPATFFIGLICAAPPTRLTEIPTSMAGR